MAKHCWKRRRFNLENGKKENENYRIQCGFIISNVVLWSFITAHICVCVCMSVCKNCSYLSLSSPDLVSLVRVTHQKHTKPIILHLYCFSFFPSLLLVHNMYTNYAQVRYVVYYEITVASESNIFFLPCSN